MADLAENARRRAQGKKPAVISPLALETVRRIDALFEIDLARNYLASVVPAKNNFQP
jgi:transposase